jgi:Mg-chelatase subunit ChlD
MYPTDTQNPYSFKEWLSIQENNLTDDPQKLYMDYLKRWYFENNKSLIDPKQKIKQEYLQLIKDLSFLFDKEEKDRFLQTIDYENKDELIYSIPFFAKKLKEIAKVLNAKRNSIKNSKLKFNLAGANDGVETLLYDYILRSFTKSENFITQVPTSKFKNIFPSLSSTKDDFFIEVEELYDTNSYYDSDPSVDIQEYINPSDLINEFPYEDLTENQIIGLLNSRFIPRVANNSLSKIFNSYLTYFDYVTSDELEPNEEEFEKYQDLGKLIGYQINASEKYLGENLYGLTAIRLKDLNQPDYVLNLNFSTGNNWFLWPSGSRLTDLASIENYLKPIPINESNFVNSGATGGSNHLDSDLIFTDKNGLVEGAWLRGPRTLFTSSTAKIKILPSSVREFLFPYVGFDLTTKGLNWIGHILNDDEYQTYQLLSKEKQLFLLEKYYTEQLPISASAPIYINQTSLIESGAGSGEHTQNSDVILKRKNIPSLSSLDADTPDNSTEVAFLYRMQRTDLPIELGINNIYWPILKFSSEQNIPITIKKDQCIPISLNDFKISEVFNGAIAGFNFEDSDIIYKLSTRTSEPIEAAWLASSSIHNLDSKTKSIKIYDEDAIKCAKYIDGPVQPSLNLKINPFEKTSFIWMDIDTPADEVFKNFDHAPYCEYAENIPHDYYNDQDYLNPQQINEKNHWKKCTCKAVNYSPIGHIGETSIDYNGITDLLFADPDGLKDNFTLKSWTDTRGYDYKNSPQFAFYKLKGNSDSPIGFGDGEWKTGNNKRFILKTGRRYTYIRTSLRKDATSNTSEEGISPFYIVKYAYKELRSFCTGILNENTSSEQISNCYDLYILLDVSRTQSLNINDTRKLVSDLCRSILNENNNKKVQIGLIAFSKDNTLLSYLTQSFGAIEFNLANYNIPNTSPEYKTHISQSLELAKYLLNNKVPLDANDSFVGSELCKSLNTVILNENAQAKTLNLPQNDCPKKIIIISDGQETVNVGTALPKAQELKNEGIQIYSVDIGRISKDNNLMEQIASSDKNYFNLEKYLKEGDGDVLSFAQQLASQVNDCSSVIPTWKKAIKQSNGVWTAMNEKSDMVIEPGDFLIYVHREGINYVSEDAGSSFVQNGVSFTWNSKLNGWNYINNTFDPNNIGSRFGGKPFWGKSNTIPNENENFDKKTNYFSGNIKFLNGYVPLRQPEVSNLILENGDFIQYYRRKNSSFEWIQPITLVTTLSDYQWNKLIFERHPSNLEGILKNGTFDFYGKATNEKSEMLLESYSDFKTPRYNYYARNSFEYQQDLYNIVRCDNTFVVFETGSILNAIEPYVNLLNLHYPTIASISIPKNLVSEKYFGGYLNPMHLGVPYYRGKGYEIEIDKNQITLYDATSAERTFFNPNKYSNRNRGLSKKDQIAPVSIKNIDNRWMMELFNAGGKAGTHINTKENQKFTPYQSTYEILGKNTLGVSRQDDQIEFWTNSLPSVWNDEKKYPLTFRKELMAQTYELRKSGLLVDKGVITNWRTDIFGNNYALFKNKNLFLIEEKNPFVELIGASWQLPCLNNNFYCSTPMDVTSIGQIGGSYEDSYVVTFRIRGVIELNNFNNTGTLIQQYVKKNITSYGSSGYNAYLLTVEGLNGLETYGLNNGVQSDPNVVSVDYLLSLTVKGNSQFILYATSVDGAQQKNPPQSQGGLPYTVSDNNPDFPIVVNQPYNGQFLQIDPIVWNKL